MSITTNRPAGVPAATHRRSEHHHVVVVGGGAAGISVAARLCKGWFHATDVAVIEPSEKHYYQPLWTLVGAGAATREETQRDEASVIPRKAKWIRDAVKEFHPDANYVLTADGQRVGYDVLVVAAGIQLNWDGVRGLKESIGTGGVCSNYAFEYVDYTWETLQNFQGGTALFHAPRRRGQVRRGAPEDLLSGRRLLPQTRHPRSLQLDLRHRQTEDLRCQAVRRHAR